MNDLINSIENNNSIYSLFNNILVSIPKNLNNNIKVFVNLKTKDNVDNTIIIKEMQEIEKNISQNKDDYLLITYFINNNLLEEGNAFDFVNELNKIKYIVNYVYNNLRLKRNLEKNSFVKKVNLLSTEKKYDDFIKWICIQEPSKFQISNYNPLYSNRNDIFINQNIPNIFNEPTRQSSMTAMQSNIKAINENLTIGTPNYTPHNNGQYSNQTPQEFYNHKRLIRTPDNKPGSAAFIKWYTTLFILVMSFIIGIGISVFLTK